jgi:hypothetical protein
MFNKKEYMKEWHKNHPTYMKQYNKKYNEEHKEDLRDYWIKWRKDNSERHNEYNKQWAKNNPEKIREKNRIYCQNNIERIKKYFREYNINNWESIKINKRQYIAKRRRTDIKFNLNSKVSRAIFHALKSNKNSRHWETLVGYTLQDLLNHLQKTIPQGYTWQDYIQGKLHIDHIIPISVFNFTKPEHLDFKRCWDLNNLRLLPKEENLRKSNKLFKPFQPSLKLCME